MGPTLSDPDAHPAKSPAEFRSSFLADLSHEVRSPLNAIIGFSELLADDTFGPLSTEQRDVVEDILAAGKHLLQLANDVLDISKIRVGKMTLDVDTLSVAALVEQALGLAAGIDPQKGMVLLQEVPEQLAVRADERRTLQVLCNLLSNAIRYTPAGGTIRVTAQAEEGLVRISVADTGHGICEANHARIFEEFVSMDRGGQSGGAGLGLSVSRRLVELMGGEIGVTSKVGAGSTFSFTLPRAEPR